jgi:excisionase family DNA binding protein
MENVFLTSLTTPEVRQIFRQELEQFFANKGAIPASAGQEEEILTIQQAAGFLNLKVPTLYTLNSKGEIPSCKRGKRLYFSKGDLVNWVKEGRRKTISEIKAEAGSVLKKKGVGHE